jgi:small ligand-binding sensory domain FIST
MACYFPESSFRVFPSVQDDLEEFDLQHRDWFGCNVQNFAVVHAAPETPDLQQLIPDLSEKLNGGYLVGGLTSSHSRNLQVADTIASGGLSGVLFSEKVSVCTGLTQGCSPIGPKRTITEVKGNVVVRIDERPALEVFKEDIGETLASDLARTAGDIFAALPVVGSDIGDYLVRNIVGIDEELGLIAIGDLPQKGSQIMFCRRDGSTARDDLARMLKQIKDRTNKAKPRGAVYFSCLGRGRYTFGTNSEEVGLITKEFGDLPLVGFFANGEISHHRLYGYTGVLTLFL